MGIYCALLRSFYFWSRCDGDLRWKVLNVVAVKVAMDRAIFEGVSFDAFARECAEDGRNGNHRKDGMTVSSAECFEATERRMGEHHG
jgi:hypothetical protein